MERYSSDTLMLVEDPRDTIMTLCKLQNKYFTKEEFKLEYEKTKQRENNPVSKGTFDTHFYSLKQFRLLKDVDSNKYIVENPGNKLCNLITNNKIDEYQEYLSRILLSNEEKSSLFITFLDYINNKNITNKEDIFKNFKEITARALISWTLEAGLINYDQDNDVIWRIKSSRGQDMPLKEFWEKLIDEYKSIERNDLFLLDDLFIDISMLRLNFCLNNRNFNLNIFDDKLRSLLKSDYKRNIRLYGGPTSTFSRRRNFNFDGKLYAFIRIKY